jgi:hypothetical protein
MNRECGFLNVKPETQHWPHLPGSSLFPDSLITALPHSHLSNRAAFSPSPGYSREDLGCPHPWLPGCFPGGCLSQGGEPQKDNRSEAMQHRQGRTKPCLSLEPPHLAAALQSQAPWWSRPLDCWPCPSPVTPTSGPLPGPVVLRPLCPWPLQPHVPQCRLRAWTLG